MCWWWEKVNFGDDKCGGGDIIDNCGVNTNCGSDHDLGVIKAKLVAVKIELMMMVVLMTSVVSIDLFKSRCKRPVKMVLTSAVPWKTLPIFIIAFATASVHQNLSCWCHKELHHILHTVEQINPLPSTKCVGFFLQGCYNLVLRTI